MLVLENRINVQVAGIFALVGMTMDFDVAWSDPHFPRAECAI
jgi:hypothetical protein